MKVTNEQLSNALTDTDRLEVLYNSNLLDTEPEKFFDRLITMICRDLNVPVSLMSIVEIDRQFFKAQKGLPADVEQARQTLISHSICQYVVQSGDTIAIKNTDIYPFFKQHPASKDLGVVAYLGTPLIKDGQVLGAICAIDTKPREWSEDDIKLIEQKANFIRSELQLRDKIGWVPETEKTE